MTDSEINKYYSGIKEGLRRTTFIEGTLTVIYYNGIKMAISQAIKLVDAERDTRQVHNWQ